VRGLVRAFARRLVAVARLAAWPAPCRAAGRGSAAPTSRRSGQSGDKSPHSKTWRAIHAFEIHHAAPPERPLPKSRGVRGMIGKGMEFIPLTVIPLPRFQFRSPVAAEVSSRGGCSLQSTSAAWEQSSLTSPWARSPLREFRPRSDGRWPRGRHGSPGPGSGRPRRLRCCGRWWW